MVCACSNSPVIRRTDWKTGYVWGRSPDSQLGTRRNGADRCLCVGSEVKGNSPDKATAHLRGGAMMSFNRLQLVRALALAMLFVLVVALKTGPSLADPNTSGPKTGDAACAEKLNACLAGCTPPPNTSQSNEDTRNCEARCYTMATICQTGVPNASGPKSGTKNSLPPSAVPGSGK